MTRLTLCLFLIVPFVGCSAFMDLFKDVPGQPPAQLPVREVVVGTSYTVSVRVLQGNFGPMCMLPDAANEIACIFRYGWLENGGMMLSGSDGYRYLNPSDARSACREATWSLGSGASDPSGGNEVVDACARALMVHRWMVDADTFEEEPK